MLIFAHGDLCVRTIDDSDVPLIARWLSDPRVLEYFGGRDDPQDEARVREYLQQPTHDGNLKEYRCMVEHAGIPIGCINFYWQQSAERGYPDTMRVWCIDVFIGEPAYWNRGIGSQLVRATAEHILHHEPADLVTIDPETWNTRAVRCYEKAGFVKTRILPKDELHEGVWHDAWLMEYTQR